MARPDTPLLTVDAVVTSPDHGVVLIRRRNPPFAGAWALPGGFVEIGESCEEACVRETLEETGLEVEIIDLVGVYSHPTRDPRFHTASVVYHCRPRGGELLAADDASDAAWFASVAETELAFDHARILGDAGIG